LDGVKKPRNSVAITALFFLPIEKFSQPPVHPPLNQRFHRKQHLKKFEPLPLRAVFRQQKK
jgi:hypothetical protein